MPEPASVSVAAIILAGGLGTRVRALYPDLPKPMIPVAGRPFLDWVLRYLREQGIAEIVISAGHLGEVIANHYRSRRRDGVPVTVVQEPEPLGTAGGFLRALSATAAERVVVLNGDSLVLAPIGALAAQGAEPAAVLGVEVDDASRYGTLCAGEQGRLLGFREKRPGRGLVNAGVYLLRRGLAAMFPRKLPLSFETEVFPALIAAGCAIRVHRCQADFLDIGTPESLIHATSFIQSHFLPR